MKKRLLDALRRLFGITQMQWDLTTRLCKLLSEERRLQLWSHILSDTQLGVSDQKYADCQIIVSLTSYGKRVQDVAFAIESIMQQTLKANRIVLWLSHDDYKHLPEALMLQQKRGLEIRECDDLLSYKKIVPSLIEFPNDAIITIDDDLMYDFDLLERLIRAYQLQPQYIHAARIHRIKYEANGYPAPYNSWNWQVPEKGPHPLNFFTSGAGTLFPPCSLDKEVLNQSVFMDICKYADDVWLNAMARKHGTLVNKVETRSSVSEDYVPNESVQDLSLRQKNVEGPALNDVQIKSVFLKYNLIQL